MPKRKFKTVRQSDDEIRDAVEDAARRVKTRPLTADQILVHLETAVPLDFSDESDDGLDDLEIEDSSEEEEVDVGVIEIKEIELPPALLENEVGSY
jgi:hypothetical protein